MRSYFPCFNLLLEREVSVVKVVRDSKLCLLFWDSVLGKMVKRVSTVPMWASLRSSQADGGGPGGRVSFWYWY